MHAAAIRPCRRVWHIASRHGSPRCYLNGCDAGANVGRGERYVHIDYRLGTPVNAAKLGLLAALVGVNVAFVLAWVRDARRRSVRPAPTLADIAIGLGTDFLDGLGIGS